MGVWSWLKNFGVKEIKLSTNQTVQIEPLPIEKHFTWPNGVGNKPCVCPCGHELEQEEVSITWHSNGWGDCRTSGAVRCVVCGRSYKWNHVDW
jgi:hypothetical protein